ncbi:hypothetical protein PHLGIDRAFT_65075 [Phlebiopsis gigantea 11061_1 CR5-6]|uniref:Yeast cell wall synthesis Kre9/Knh1-like N-terminal domain-containing protein n=1 Tax=Phlebiopsis gigantea (strain 11061_1 CR5-6) TaxID=745531 RepID=A0A0C3PT61_PHLG1|nr:hypothetical protein PHLGIDRAFT_65075 [Phlebiopsis gigantea 11061_1 CR5-6]
MRTVATLFAFAASALALQVTQPTNATGWSTSGSNTVAWNAVSTDPSNFTVVLVNMNEFPNYSQILDALVVTSLDKQSVNPPSSGWPTGHGFQINLVADNEHLSTILAQSEQFSFIAPSGSSSGVSSTPASSASGATMTVPASSQ